MGNLEFKHKYGGTISKGSSFWFINKKPILYNLMNDSILTKKEVHACLTSDVTTVQKLKDKLTSKYSSKKDTILSYF